MKKIALVGIAVVGCIITGCAHRGQPNAKDVADGDGASCAAEEFMAYDLDAGVTALVTNMLEHPAFKRTYESMKAKREELPSLVISPFKCNFPAADMQPRLDMIKTRVSISLLESGKFTVRNEPLADAIGIGAPDCRLQCFVSRVREKGGCYGYRLHVCLTDLCSASTMWEGEKAIPKID